MGNGAIPFSVCSMPTAQVWHQRGWLNVTPYADPFSLLADGMSDSPEFCLWNRNGATSFTSALIPDSMIGLWDPARIFMSAMIFGSPRNGPVERLHRRCRLLASILHHNLLRWRNLFGGNRSGQQVYPPRRKRFYHRGFLLVIDKSLRPRKSNDRFRPRLFASFTNSSRECRRGMKAPPPPPPAPAPPFSETPPNHPELDSRWRADR